MLNQLQDALEIINGVSIPHRVEDFVLRREHLKALGQTEHAPETLYVHEAQGQADIGLYVSPEVMFRLERFGTAGHGLLGAMLPAFTTALEGVSHFLYLVVQASRERPVSRLELEVQAEIDKFATSLLHLWREGAREGVGELRARLFNRVHFRATLDEEERSRYVLANRLARGYAAFLDARFVAPGRLEELLRELRFTFRLAAGEKFAYLARRA